MEEKELILYGARHAVLKMLEKGNCMLVVKSEDGTHQSIEYEDICNYLTEEIEKSKNSNQGE
jgi:hypothetical protein